VWGEKVDVQLRTFWVVLAEIATSLYSSGSLRSGAGDHEFTLMCEDVKRLNVAARDICRGCRSCWE